MTVPSKWQLWSMMNTPVASRQPLRTAWLRPRTLRLWLIPHCSEDANALNGKLESNASHPVPSLSAPCPGASSIAQPPAHPMEHVQEVAALSSCPQDHSRSGSGGEWTRSSSRCNLSDGEAWRGRVRRACSGSWPPTARRAGDGRGTGGTPVSEVVQSSWKPPPH